MVLVQRGARPDRHEQAMSHSRRAHDSSLDLLGRYFCDENQMLKTLLKA